jgi:hypothetical protein
MTGPSDPDDEFVALGKLQRSRLAARADEWAGLATGELSPEQARALRRAAGDDPEDVELGVEIFRPFDEDDDQALADALLREPSLREQPEEPVQKKLIRWPFAAAVLLAAAAIALVWLWPRGPDPETRLAAVAPLPEYGIELTRGIEYVRGDEQPNEPLRLAAEVEFEWVLRPVEDVGAAVVANVFAYPAQGFGRQLELGDALQTANSGVVRIAGRGELLGLEPGKWTVVIVLAREGEHDPGDVFRLHPRIAATPEPGWHTTQIELEFVE